jgi:hypothetical protein
MVGGGSVGPERDDEAAASGEVGEGVEGVESREGRGALAAFGADLPGASQAA